MSRQTIDVLTVTIALVVAAAALSAFTGAGLASGSASTATTTIDSCTTIEELGTYTLNSDIENSNRSIDASANRTAAVAENGIDNATADEERADTIAGNDSDTESDEVSTCIAIAASDVTFSGDGHTIDGGRPRVGVARSSDRRRAGVDRATSS